MNFLLQLIIDGAFAATASFGFGMVFNVPKHTLKYCALGGAIVYSLRTIFLHLKIGIEISTWLATAGIGIIAFDWSRKNKITERVYTVASIMAS